MPPTKASGASPYTSIGPPSPEVTGVFCRVPSPRFSRSPWYSLPDHLCRFRVRAAINLARRFSWQHRIIHFALRLGIRSQTMRCGFAYTPSYILTPGQPSPGLNYLPASLHCLTTTNLGRALHSLGLGPRKLQALSIIDSPWAVYCGCWNINQLSIDYACRPRLRSRLTLGGLAWPRNPWSFGGRVSHPSFATHVYILTRVASTAGFPRRFAGYTTLSYPSTLLGLATGIMCE